MSRRSLPVALQPKSAPMVGQRWCTCRYLAIGVKKYPANGTCCCNRLWLWWFLFQLGYLWEIGWRVLVCECGVWLLQQFYLLRSANQRIWRWTTNRWIHYGPKMYQESQSCPHQHRFQRNKKKQETNSLWKEKSIKSNQKRNQTRT